MKKFLLSRRAFLAAAAAGGAAYAGSRYVWKQKIPEVPVFVHGAASSAGHLIRGEKFPEPGTSRDVGIAIVGGGMSGLSAAWHLKKQGYDDFALLELEEHPGGNAQSGENSVTPYPWGAHYVPLPGPDATLVQELFEEIGIITGRDGKGLPIYNEQYLCAAPQERLLIDGRWQEGMLPQLGALAADHADYHTFFAFIDTMKDAKGSDGKWAFSIPSEFSSRDERYLAYDQITMHDLVSKLGIRSPYLLWYLNYSYRDDFGVGMDRVSAWAGIHYFASRRFVASGIKESTLVTWPEGNGFLVNQLVKKVGKYITQNAVVYDVANTSKGVTVRYLDRTMGTSHEIKARSAIYAAPRFTAPYVIAELRSNRPAYAASMQYIPWVVGNITLGPAQDLRHLDKIAWDNVFYGGESLGYVNATHQSLRRSNGETVLTYYLPLSNGDPAEQRKRALDTTPEQWRERILTELLRFEPDLSERVRQLDVWVWGHAMREPSPGAIWGEYRAALREPAGKIHFAHSDMSGFSIFEEAQYHGVTAAKNALLTVQAA